MSDGRAWTCMEPAWNLHAADGSAAPRGGSSEGKGASLKGFRSRGLERVVWTLHLTRRSTPEGVRRIVRRCASTAAHL